mgnify:CR=1 FL=1
MFVAKTESKSAARDAMPPTVFFNPRLEFPKKKAQLISNEQQVPIVMWEGCLSVPGMVYVCNKRGSTMDRDLERLTRVFAIARSIAR